MLKSGASERRPGAFGSKNAPLRSRGQLGVYVLPDRLWELTPENPEETSVESDFAEESDGPLQMHTAIEGFYEATDFVFWRTLSRGLGDMFSSVSAALEGQSGLNHCGWNDERDLSFNALKVLKPQRGG